ncbi:MAG TPA: penicillin acylase family protein [Lysobacter sp.]|nr:penicillin acylase family protein [Lysobacter sp.]
MRKWILRALVALLALVALTAVAATIALRASLPALDGEAPLARLSAPAVVHRDALGVVTVEANDQRDAMRALGYVHAQERFFEMDLMRRAAAGELAALFGVRALDYDKRQRMHRMRARAVRDLAALPAGQRSLLQAYADGVNAGLADLRARPWPYLLLRQPPVRWQTADTALVGHAMYFDLQDASNARELALDRLARHLPPALFSLLAHDGTSWDAPLTGTARGDAVLPAAEAVDLRRLPFAPGAEDAPLRETRAPGSNNFAVAGALTADGRAIVADDMHLGLRAPNIWFRARLRYPDARAPGGRVDVAGFTLPGIPGVIVGSNGHVAWGFTNSYVDTADWARQRPCGRRAVADCVPVRTYRERIDVADGESVTLDVRETAWGPVLHEENDGHVLALRWTAHLPGALNFALLDMARAADLDGALAVASAARIPTQNLLVGDRHGRIAWRWIGGVPQRPPQCMQLYRWSAARCAPWGFAPDDTLPVVNGERLWTANGRVVDGAALALAGDGGYALGARAWRIRERLQAQARFTERDLLAIQLDDRALLLERWWRLLQDEAARTRTPGLRELAAAAKDWPGHARVDSASYRIVRAWRLAVHERLLDGLIAPARARLDEELARPDLPQFEGVAWPLLAQRPAHLLPRPYASWGALLEDAARQVRDELATQGPLAERTWGERNTAAICHPLANALPLFGPRALCMPREPLPGDGTVPRVQGPTFGASERMVVAPGHEADGIVHMPGGQSGHPLSPFWGAGHDDWVHGRPTPFLPGKARHTLRLVPAR